MFEECSTFDRVAITAPRINPETGEITYTRHGDPVNLVIEQQDRYAQCTAAHRTYLAPIEDRHDEYDAD